MTFGRADRADLELDRTRNEGGLGLLSTRCHVRLTTREYFRLVQQRTNEAATFELLNAPRRGRLNRKFVLLPSAVQMAHIVQDDLPRSDAGMRADNRLCATGQRGQQAGCECANFALTRA